MIIKTMNEINLCESLEQLFDLLKDKGESIDERILASLPTYNVYHEPTDTQGIWSYDDQRAIVGQCIDDFQVVKYSTGGAIFDGIVDNIVSDIEAISTIDEDCIEDYAWEAMNMCLNREQSQAISAAVKEWFELIEAGEATKSEWDRLCESIHFTAFGD